MLPAMTVQPVMAVLLIGSGVLQDHPLGCRIRSCRSEMAPRSEVPAKPTTRSSSTNQEALHRVPPQPGVQPRIARGTNGMFTEWLGARHWSLCLAVGNDSPQDAAPCIFTTQRKPNAMGNANNFPARGAGPLPATPSVAYTLAERERVVDGGPQFERTPTRGARDPFLLGQRGRRHPERLRDLLLQRRRPGRPDGLAQGVGGADQFERRARVPARGPRVCQCPRAGTPAPTCRRRLR